ncbi:DUF2637 domain-containing protein [Actinophytocola glycyrrhizae]|uniref:DUF2637 domain-containing protein n=1 Tax=Actinophytocola glycyrrhizae TaxID=2044873 RepID=A0ABV9SDG3_9PSEU
MTAMTESAGLREQVSAEEWVRRVCTLLVAGVAAYASYQHQRDYARVGGSDSLGAALWPLSVDGLLVLATVGVLKAEQLSRRGRVAVWVSFWLGISVSLVANISAAPSLTLQPILVAGWPPVALLLAVELLAHGPNSRQHTETAQATSITEQAAPETDQTATAAGTTIPTPVRDHEGVVETSGASGGETANVITLAGVSPHDASTAEPTAQEIMWSHFQREQADGRTPTGAELDRVAGTNNYGRTVLRQWRSEGRIPPADQQQRVRGGVG